MPWNIKVCLKINKKHGKIHIKTWEANKCWNERGRVHKKLHSELFFYGACTIQVAIIAFYLIQVREKKMYGFEVA